MPAHSIHSLLLQFSLSPVHVYDRCTYARINVCTCVCTHTYILDGCMSRRYLQFTMQNLNSASHPLPPSKAAHSMLFTILINGKYILSRCLSQKSWHHSWPFSLSHTLCPNHQQITMILPSQYIFKYIKYIYIFIPNHFWPFSFYHPSPDPIISPWTQAVTSLLDPLTVHFPANPLTV